MKRIIRLTESDLARIVKQVINEQNPPYRPGMEPSTKKTETSPIGVNPTLKPDFNTRDALNGTRWKALESDIKNLGFKGKIEHIKEKRPIINIGGYPDLDFYQVNLDGPNGMKVTYPAAMLDYDSIVRPNWVDITIPYKPKPNSCLATASDADGLGSWVNLEGGKYKGFVKVWCKKEILELLKGGL